MKSTEILGIRISTLDFNDSVEKVFGWIKEGGYHMVFTPNPEFLVEAQKDKDFFNILNKGDLVIPDGIGVLIASKLNRIKIKERVPGCDLISELFKRMNETGGSVYIFGGKPGVAKKACAEISAQYNRIVISGWADGYFDRSGERKIIKEIQSKKPDLLLVGLSFPKQEKWIYANRNRLPVKVAIGCGGSIDVFAKEVKRAPAAFRKLGMEWFYRLISQPSRFFRMLNLPKFLGMAVIDKIKE